MKSRVRLVDIECDRRLYFVVVSRGHVNLIGGSSSRRNRNVLGIGSRACALGENNKRRCGEEQQVPEEVCRPRVWVLAEEIAVFTGFASGWFQASVTVVRSIRVQRKFSSNPRQTYADAGLDIALRIRDAV